MEVSSSGQQPHKPGPLHQSNKPHKGGRNSRRKFTATSEIKNKILSKPSSKLRREDRLNQAHQTRLLKREKTVEEKRRLGPDSQPPILIGVMDPRTNSCKDFFEQVLASEDESAIKCKSINQRSIYVLSNRLKMRFKLVALDSLQFDESLDIAKTLDVLILLHRPDCIDYDDDGASLLLRSIRIHCLPTTVHVITAGSTHNNPKQLIEAKRFLRSRVGEDKIHCVEKFNDCLQLFNIVGNCKRLKSHFKETRPTIVADEIEIIDGCLALRGFVRKKILNPNDLVHLIGFDDYQIKQIDILPDPISLKPTSVEGLQVVDTLKPDPMKQETLDQENDVDPMEGEQTWPTAEELAAEAERHNTRRVVKKLPPGTSSYQGAWIPEGSSEDEEDYSESSDSGDRMSEVPEDSDGENQEQEHPDEFDVDQEEGDVQVEVMEVDNYDKNQSTEKEFRILEKLREARQEEMFPDEVDTPFDIPARVRFARYRGLKSFRTSAWDPQENLPPDYIRIFQFQNFQHSRRRLLKERPRDGADPGQYVRVHLANVTKDVIDKVLAMDIPPYLVGLLKYERKITVMNYLIKRLPDSDLSNPIKSKDELIFYVGFRKFKAKPLFTTHSVSPKFKYERFLRDDIAMVATMYAPITFPPAPILVFRQGRGNQRELVASGSVLESNPNRLIIKRIRLSGHPHKIHSKAAVIRFMFFNSEDVLYFKPVELITKYNRRGHITEPLGTHGHMKCTFDKKIKSDDCIFMNLYKRVFPKWTYTPITL